MNWMDNLVLFQEYKRSALETERYNKIFQEAVNAVLGDVCDKCPLECEEISKKWMEYRRRWLAIQEPIMSGNWSQTPSDQIWIIFLSGVMNEISLNCWVQYPNQQSVISFCWKKLNNSVVLFPKIFPVQGCFVFGLKRY